MQNDDETRPDPDKLLKRIEAESKAADRGLLKIFFGYAAGVGKTYAMLKAAQTQLAAGVQVAVGYVEPHGRKETEALLDGLEILPLKEVEYRGVKLKEFDLDVALLIRPELILVDELAHTNAPGMRHAKRWQDVEELLNAGVNVYTTVNVQHVESINDIVTQITGIEVKETIPDTILDRADQIELLDIPPDDLLQRLREGKVYIPAKAERAMQSFFQKGNLIALREISLRRTADRVSNETQVARAARDTKSTWPTVERLLVCIGPSPTSAKVIRTARRLAAALKADWIGVSVETESTANMSAGARQRLEHNIKLAEKLGAEVVVLHGEDVAKLIVDYGLSRNVTKILIGKNLGPTWYRRFKPTIVDELLGISGDIDVYVIRGVSEPTEKSAAPVKKPVNWKNYLGAGVVMLLSFAGAWVFNRVGLSEANIVMIILLGVIVSSTRFGRYPSVIVSVVGVLTFDFFFVPPYYSFTVYDTQYVITFAVMLAVALITSGLTTRIRGQARLIQQRERRTEALYKLTRKLSTLSGVEKLVIEASSQISEVFGGEAVIFLPDAHDYMKPMINSPSAFASIPKEKAVAQWVYRNKQAAGIGTDTLPESAAYYVPLTGFQGITGVIGLRPMKPEGFQYPDFRRLLETFATQVAIAIERDVLSQKNQQILIEAEAEKMRAMLLSSVSHDLRTPLTGIAGASGSLIDEFDTYDDATKKNLLQTIYDESNRLVKFIENLLNMTSLESGKVTVKKEWQPVEEVVGSALTRMQKQLIDHPTHTDLADDLPMGLFDGVLIEQVLINLLENAVKYSEKGAPIDISAGLESGAILITVSDRGIGMPEGDTERIFEKFYRAGAAEIRNQRGAGLGLAICRAIITAHGGRIWAENRPGGGARFCFTIPQESPLPKLAGQD